MYEAVADPYCYPGTTVLKNRLGLQDQAALDLFEAEITAQRAAEPLPTGRLNYAHYRAIHRHLFQDVFSWAGKIRTVRISKEGSTFCYPENIDREMRRLFHDLSAQNYLEHLDVASFSAVAAHFLAELNAIHPFREGNGRTQLAFLTLLAERAGHPLAMEQLDPPAILKAVVESFEGREQPLAQLIAGLIQQ
jgi:cell filamentation protein